MSMTKEEVEAAIESGNMEVVNGLLDGSLEVGEAEAPDEGEVTTEEAPVEDNTDTTEEVTEQPSNTSEETDNGETGTEFEDSIKMLEETKKEYEAKLEAERVRLEAEAVAAKEEARLSKLALEQIKKRKEDAEFKVKIEEDEDDLDLAGTFSKNNRALIEEIRQRIEDGVDNTAVEELVNRLEKIEKADSERQAEYERKAAIEAEKRKMKDLFKEVDEFQNAHKSLSLGKTVEEANQEHVAFKTAVAEVLGTNDNSLIEKAARGILRGDSKFSSLRKKVTDKEIQLPENHEQYYKLAALVDARNGYQYNEVTGNYDAITDSYGNQVVQRSLEDAFKLSDLYASDAERAGREQSLEIQRILDNREESATTLPDSSVADATESEAMTAQEMEALFATDSMTIKRNPALAKKLEMAYKQLKM